MSLMEKVSKFSFGRSAATGLSKGQLAKRIAGGGALVGAGAVAGAKGPEMVDDYRQGKEDEEKQKIHGILRQFQKMEDGEELYDNMYGGIGRYGY